MYYYSYHHISKAFESLRKTCHKPEIELRELGHSPTVADLRLASLASVQWLAVPLTVDSFRS